MDKSNNKLNSINKLSKMSLATLMLGSVAATSFGNISNAATNDNTDDSTKSSDQKNASFKVNVNDSKINKAVEDAKKEGVNVTKDADKSKTVPIKDLDKSQKEIQADYDKQIAELEKATKEAQNTASKNSQAQKSYEAELAKYNKEKEAYDKEVQAVKDYNDKAKKDYADKVAKAKEDVKKADDNPTQPKYSEGDNNGYSASGSWTNLKSKTLNGGDIHVSASGEVKDYNDLKNGNFTIHAYSDKNGTLKNSNIIQNIHWGNDEPKGKTVTKGDKITEDAQAKVPGYTGDIYNTSGANNPDGKTTQLHSVKAGEWVTIPNAVKLADGSSEDLKVKFTKSGTNLDYGEDWITFWNEGGAINYYDGSHDINNTPPKDKITATYQVADGKEKFLWTGATLDIDGGQKLTMEDNNYAILAMGGGLKADGDTIKSIKSDDNLGKTWGKNRTDDNFLDGTRSVPDGTVVFARYDSQISHTLENTGVTRSTLVANGDFGSKVNTSVVNYPKLKQEPEPPKAPTKPTDEKVNVKASYHLNKLNVTPTNHKDVEKGIQKEDTKDSIDKQKVEIGDQITYPLTNSDLPANRSDDITSYKMKDKLPEGVEPDKDETIKNVDKSKWDVKIEGNNVTVTAKKELLDEMNKDKTKAFKVPHVGLVATVIGGNAKPLDNTFDTFINDQIVKSNKVTNTPPPIVKKEAKKSVSTNEIIDFEKEYQYGLDFTVPNDKNYKKVQFKDHDMTNGSLDFEDVKVYADIPESDSTSDSKDDSNNKSDESKDNESTESKDNTSNETTKTDDTKTDDSQNADGKSEESAKDVFGSEQQASEDTADSTESTSNNKSNSDESSTDNKTSQSDDQSTDSKSDENKGRDITKEGKLEFDKEKDTFTWTANNPTKLLGKKVHIDIKSKVKDGKTLEKYKTNDKDENGNTIYSLPNIGHMVLDDKDTPTNEVPIRVVKAEPSIKKYIVEDNNLLERNKSKEGNKLTYQLDAQFGIGKPKSISDQLDKEKLDLDDVKVYEDNSNTNKSDENSNNKDNESSDDKSNENSNNKDNESLSDKDNESSNNEKVENQVDDSNKDESNKDESNKDESKDDESKNDESKNDESNKDESNKDESNKDDESKNDESKNDESKNDESDKDESDKNESDKNESKDVKGQALDTKSAKDITDQGKLELNKDNESFTWTPNDPSKFNNKKVKVIIDSTIKKDLKYENGKAQIENVADLQDGDKKLKSNKVLTELEKKETPPQKEQPKEQPKTPEQPQKEQPQKEQPKQESPLPSTGSQTADAILYGAAGLLGLTGLYYGIRRFKNRNN